MGCPGGWRPVCALIRGMAAVVPRVLAALPAADGAGVGGTIRTVPEASICLTGSGDHERASSVGS